MAKSRPKKTEVSIKKENHDRLKKEAARRKIPVTKLLDEILEGSFKGGIVYQDKSPKEVFGPPGDVVVPGNSPVLQRMVDGG